MKFYLADPAFIEAMPRQIDWQADKARVTAPDFAFDAQNPCSGGVMDAVRNYYLLETVRGNITSLPGSEMYPFQPGKEIYVEIKCGSEVVPALVEELAAYGLQPDQVLVISFNEKVLATLFRIKADGLSSNVDIPEEVIHAVQQRGMPWHVWTVNQVAQARHLRGEGVESITTDVPAVIRAGLGLRE